MVYIVGRSDGIIPSKLPLTSQFHSQISCKYYNENGPYSEAKPNEPKPNTIALMHKLNWPSTIREYFRTLAIEMDSFTARGLHAENAFAKHAPESTNDAEMRLKSFGCHINCITLVALVFKILLVDWGASQ